MPTSWPGRYFDGQRPVAHPATVGLTPTQLNIAVEAGATFQWPYAEIRQTQGAYEGEQIRLERGGEFPETLVVEDRAFLEDLRRIAPGLARRFQSAPPRRVLWLFAGASAAAVVALAAGLYLWAFPAIVTQVVQRVPVSWEARLGERTVDHLAPSERRCAEPAVVGAIDDMVKTLVATRPSPYTFRVVVVRDQAVNAFAAPGGFLVVNRGLLESTRTPEELAGVLAHEIQHVLQRHATRALVQQASTGLLIAAAVGDPSGAMAYGVEAARVLGALRYSRVQEEEADVQGMKMLREAGLDPQGMIAFFGTLKTQGDMPQILKYLSTHPATQDRIDRLRAMAAGPPPPSVKLPVGGNWDEIKKLCAPPAARRAR